MLEEEGNKQRQTWSADMRCSKEVLVLFILSSSPSHVHEDDAANDAGSHTAFINIDKREEEMTGTELVEILVEKIERRV